MHASTAQNRWSASTAIQSLTLGYIVVGALIGFVVVQSPNAERGCWPYGVDFGMFETHCSNAAMTVFWFIAVGLPRLAIVVPGLALQAATTSLRTSYTAMAWLNATLPWAVLLLLIVYVVWAGSLWRRGRALPIRTVLVAILALEIGYFGLEPRLPIIGVIDFVLAPHW